MATTGKLTKAQREKKEHDDATASLIRASLVGYYPGKWSDILRVKPVCICGKPMQKWHAEGGGVPNGICYRHPWAHVFTKAGL